MISVDVKHHVYLLTYLCYGLLQSLVDKAYLKNHWGAAKLMGKKNQEHLLHLFRVSLQHCRIHFQGSC